MNQFTKLEMKELRTLTKLAYERELNRELEKLEKQFVYWKKDSINAFELNEFIRKYHHGIQRELYKCYELNSNKALLVASALARDILTPDQLSEPLYKKISPLLELFK